MVGFAHEKLVELTLEMAPEILGFVDIPVTEFTTEKSGDFSDLEPVTLLADGVILVTSPTRRVVVVEVQLSLNAKQRRQKAFTWPHYTIAARSMYRCPADLLVVTTVKSIERFASTPLELSTGQFWVPRVIGPSSLPEHPTRELASKQPTVALLSLLAHGRKLNVLTPLLEVLAGWEESPHFRGHLAEHKRELYTDWVLQKLPRGLVAQFEEIPMERYEYKSSFARRYFDEGREEGREEGLRAAILITLEDRGIPLDANQLEYLNDQNDIETLRDWLRIALRASATAELFKS